MNEKVTIQTLFEMKRRGEKISSITAYDYVTATLADRAGIDLIFVGDSLGMVVLGLDSTVPVTMEQVVHHLRPVVRARKRAFIVADMPFGSYQISREEALRNAVWLMKEGADAVKMEGGGPTISLVHEVVQAGIPCMGHLGITPQYISMLGGYKARGKVKSEARRIIDDALSLEEAGAFALQLECVAAPVSRLITEKLRIPVFGAGCGVDTDAQGINIYDALGLFDRYLPKMSKQYVNLWEVALQALRTFHQEVKEKKFPERRHWFSMEEEELRGLMAELEKE